MCIRDRDYTIRELQEKIFENGKLIYKSPTLKEIARKSKKELDSMWEEVKRIENPHKYYVDPVSYTHLDVYKRQLYRFFYYATKKESRYYRIN